VRDQRVSRTPKAGRRFAAVRRVFAARSQGVRSGSQGVRSAFAGCSQRVRRVFAARSQRVRSAFAECSQRVHSSQIVPVEIEVLCNFFHFTGRAVVVLFVWFRSGGWVERYDQGVGVFPTQAMIKYAICSLNAQMNVHHDSSIACTTALLDLILVRIGGLKVRGVRGQDATKASLQLRLKKKKAFLGLVSGEINPRLIFEHETSATRILFLSAID
jgi:hypothetical protein